MGFSRKTDTRSCKRALEWSPWIGKHGVGRPWTRWNDDLFMVADKNWMRMVGYRAQWRTVGEAYVQQGTKKG